MWKSGHKSPVCPQKYSKPKSEWHITKVKEVEAEQHNHLNVWNTHSSAAGVAEKKFVGPMLKFKCKTNFNHSGCHPGLANKMIDGKQCKILWHVDDLKISHETSEVVASVIALINAEFGNEAPITVQRGKIHEYLGMTLDFTKPGKVMILMTEYIVNTLDSLDIPTCTG